MCGVERVRERSARAIARETYVRPYVNDTAIIIVIIISHRSDPFIMLKTTGISLVGFVTNGPLTAYTS